MVLLEKKNGQCNHVRMVVEAKIGTSDEIDDVLTGMVAARETDGPTVSRTAVNVHRSVIARLPAMRFRMLNNSGGVAQGAR